MLKRKDLLPLFIILPTVFLLSIYFSLRSNSNTLSKLVGRVRGEEEIIEELVEETEENEIVEEVGSKDVVVEEEPLEETETENVEELTVEEAESDISGEEEKESIEEGVQEEKIEKFAVQDTGRKDAKYSGGSGPLGSLIVLSVLDTSMDSLPDAQVEEIIGLAGFTLTVNGQEVPVTIDWVDTPYRYYGFEMEIEEGLEYNAFFKTPPIGYLTEYYCYDLNTNEDFDLPYAPDEGKEFSCDFVLIKQDSFGLTVKKVLLDEKDNVVSNIAGDFTAKLTRVHDSRVLTDTMTTGSSSSDAYFTTLLNTMISGSPDPTDKFVLTEIPKDGFEFLGCKEIKKVGQTPSPSLIENVEFNAADYALHEPNAEGDGSGVTTCYSRVLTNSYLEMDKSNDSKDGIKPGTDVKFTVRIKAPADNNDKGNYITKNVRFFDRTPSGFTFKKGTGSVTSSKRGVINIPEPTYNNSDWALWGLGDMVEGEEIVIEYTTLTSLDIKPGIYEDQGYVKGVSIMGGEVLGNVSTGKSNTEYVSTQIKILGVGTGALPNTGSSTYLTVLGLVTLLSGVVLLLSRKENLV